MTNPIRHQVDVTRSPGEGTLSHELEKRILELQLQLLEHRQAPSCSSSAFHFGPAAEAAAKDLAAATFADMTDSSEDTLLANLEEIVPVRADFGPFRGRRE